MEGGSELGFNDGCPLGLEDSCHVGESVGATKKVSLSTLDGWPVIWLDEK